MDAGCSRAGDRRPVCPAPGPSVDGIAPGIPEGVPDLSQVPTKELDRFIQDHLKPSPQFQKQVSKAVDGILGRLRENCVHKASRVGKVSSRWRHRGDPLGGPPWGQEGVTETPLRADRGSGRHGGQFAGGGIYASV